VLSPSKRIATPDETVIYLIRAERVTLGSSVAAIYQTSQIRNLPMSGWLGRAIRNS